MKRAPLGNMNGQRGQTGGLQTFAFDADTTVIEWYGGGVLEVDPGGGTVTITLPDSGPGPGFFGEVMQVGAGTVSIRAAAGTTIVSTAGAIPDLTAQWSAARFRRREGSGGWAVDGAI